MFLLSTIFRIETYDKNSNYIAIDWPSGGHILNTKLESDLGTVLRLRYIGLAGFADK